MSDNFVSLDPPKKANGVSLASFICGVVGVCCCNPFYLMNIAAAILGIIGLATSKGRPKGMAIAGLCLGLGGLVLQGISDFVITLLTGGLGVFSFFI